MSLPESITTFLPPGDGLLPKWLLFIAVVSLGNSISCYVSLAGSRSVYTGISKTTQTTGSGDKKSSTNSPVNELSSRTFGTWTAITSIVRLYTAYNISNRVAYELGLWTFVIAFAHFVSEWLIFRSASVGKGLVSPFIVASSSMIWMWLQWDHYVQ